MMAIDLLVAGKTDTELLNTLVAALTDHSNALIQDLRNVVNAKSYDQSSRANIEVLASIVNTVRGRLPTQSTIGEKSVISE
jgi:hypothetical protein